MMHTNDFENQQEKCLQGWLCWDVAEAATRRDSFTKCRALPRLVSPVHEGGSRDLLVYFRMLELGVMSVVGARASDRAEAFGCTV